MKRYAFGAIDLLIGLVLISVVFIIGMKTFKPISSLENSSDLKNVQEQVDKQVEEIEKLRLENIELQNEMMK